MLSDLQTWTVIGLAALVWLALSAVGIASGGPAAALAIADVVPFLLLAASLFERRIWQWPRLHPHVVGTPVLRGTWKGTMTALWSDPATGAAPEPKAIYLAVEQTLTTVAVSLFTDESTSRSIAGSVANVPGRGWVLSYTYLNTPRIERRVASPIHYGGALLSILDGGGVTIEGEYWNDRASKGRLVFRERTADVARSIEHAATMAWGKEMPVREPGSPTRPQSAQDS
jgi:hypothetical protein